jgi:CubicO group peptidase (beta-lactamase class C family)
MELAMDDKKRRIKTIVLGSVLLVAVIAAVVLLYPFFPIPACTGASNRVANVDELDACIDETVRARELPGMAVAVVANGEVAWSQGYGYANIEEGRPVTADTPFLLASISKTITGTALMQAWEEGAFSLDDDVDDLLPFEVDNPQVEGEVITVRHLATHTSGIEDNDEVYNSSYAPGDPEIPLGEFLDDYFSTEGKSYDPGENFSANMPGEVYSYSNIAAGLAGYLVETTTGIPLDAYSREHIFEPLAMDNTGWFLSDFEDTSVIAVPYQSTRQGKVALEHYGFPTWPDGLVRASANDLARFQAAIMNGGELDGQRILEETTVEAMLEPQFPDMKTDFVEHTILFPHSQQALFWHSYNGWYGHEGGDDGAATFMYFDPKTQVGAVVIINQANATSYMAGRRILQLILRSGDALSGTLAG